MEEEKDWTAIFHRVTVQRIAQASVQILPLPPIFFVFSRSLFSCLSDGSNSHQRLFSCLI
ncbi:unnamed protein product [Ilex paraguariensis]|uniref:Uncharacterized protein n=1 Tax=Ilex paraguariensis TaxID=185542 RepID=A0ABC8RFQ9_9AQUA